MVKAVYGMLSWRWCVGGIEHLMVQVVLYTLQVDKVLNTGYVSGALPTPAVRGTVLYAPSLGSKSFFAYKNNVSHKCALTLSKLISD